MAMPWVESPFFDELLEASDLDPEQRKLARHYSERGYVVIDTEIPDQTIQAAIDGLAGQYGTFQHSYDTRIQDAEVPAVREIAAWPKVLDVLRVLYRREPIPFQTLNFEVGTQQPIHNDAIHFHCLPHRFMCGVWLALEDVDHENGPLFYYPGSHRLPIYEMPDFGLPAHPDSYPRYEQALESLMPIHGLESEELHVRRGQALVWAANLHHGGTPVIDSSRTRLSQVSHYYFEDCVYYSPQGSDLVRGKLQLRDVRNLLTGEMAPHVYQGEVIHRPVRPGYTMLEARGSDGAVARPVATAWQRVKARIRMRTRLRGLKAGLRR